MKHTLFLPFFLLFCTCLFAQSSHFKVTENSIVQDSSGMVYPYVIWKSLTMKGDYGLLPLDAQNEKAGFLLVKLTDQQKIHRMENMPKPGESSFFRTGKDFSFFKTSDIYANKIDLKEDKGKIIVLNFWFVNCPPCRMEIPDLNELVETYKGNDSVKFIGIALDEKADLQDFLKTFPFNYTIVHNGGYIASRYNIRSYPTHVIIDQQGKVYFHTTGLAPNTVYWLNKSITELLNRSSVVQR